MSFLILIALIVIVWLLWTLCRNTGDALDKQTALQYEIVALEKRIEQLVERYAPPTPAASETKRRAAPRKSAAKKPSSVKKSDEANKPAETAAKADQSQT